MELNRIVVGVDDSSASFAALRWAAQFACLHGTELSVVTVRPRPLPSTAIVSAGFVLPDYMAVEHTWIEWQHRILEQVLGESRHAVTIMGHVLLGDTIDELTVAAAGHDLLVLGTHAGQRTSRLLRRCLRRATVPVVLIPDLRSSSDDRSAHQDHAGCW